MNDLREQLATIVSSGARWREKGEYILADAIIAALPGMVQPLVWEGAVSRLDNGCYYAAIVSRSGKSVCVDYVSRGSSHHIGYLQTFESAKAAAQAHYAATILSAFGVQGGET